MGLFRSHGEPMAGQKSSGKQTVSYRDARGVVHDAVIVNKDSATVLDLKLPSRPKASQYVNNVPKRTGIKQTGVWF